MEDWPNRIVGYDVVDADQLLANPYNSRVHGIAQQKAMEGVLTGIGWCQGCVVNRTTGHIIDGHMRVSMAISAEQKVPVTYVELTEEEELQILATFDPIGQMALLDLGMYQQLTEQIGQIENGAIAHIIEKTSSGPGFDTDTDSLGGGGGGVGNVDGTGGDLSAPATEDFQYGFLHWGATHVDCKGEEIEQLTKLHNAYRANNDGRDRGFLAWLTEPRGSELL